MAPSTNARTRSTDDSASQETRFTPAEAMEVAVDQKGRSLAAHSNDRPALVVFLRHFGCTFCRETLADLKRHRADFGEAGVGVVVVHMGTDDEAAYVLDRYGLGDLPRVSDPLRRIYRAFELRRGTAGQLFGWRVWVRALWNGSLFRHGVGRPIGSGLQMPGVFLISGGEIVHAYRHRTAADRPDYESIAKCGLCPS